MLLVISVVYRGCAVPILWKVLPAGVPHPWQPEWRALLKARREQVPPTWTVIVLADRGLYAKWWFEGIQQLGGHPLLRVNQGGDFRPEGGYPWRPFTDWAPTVGSRWPGRGMAFRGQKTRLDCTRLVYWGEGHEEPWLILIDLPPQAAAACWYGLRAGIEQGGLNASSGAVGNGSIPA